MSCFSDPIPQSFAPEALLGRVLRSAPDDVPPYPQEQSWDGPLQPPTGHPDGRAPTALQDS